MRYSFYDFFAGGGMASVGLGPDWRCMFANEIDAKKASSYWSNHADDALLVRDVAEVTTADLPGRADLAWASFPCQDLSLAGARAGLRGARSGTFRPFWSLMRALAGEGRAPRVIAIENVVGALTSRDGADFDRIARGFSGLGYRFGALVADAAPFTAQSRPRLFVIGVAADLPALGARSSGAQDAWHPASVRAAHARLSASAARRWVWWTPPAPPRRNADLADIVDADRGPWRSEAQTAALLGQMAEPSRRRVVAARTEAAHTGASRVGAVYRRIRREADGVKRQRAEVRFDGLAGCLRTPAGGSSRQMLLFVEPDRIRSRWLAPREAARLMGLPDGYRLPTGATDALKLIGDGVAPPVVAHLARHIVEPCLDGPAVAAA